MKCTAYIIITALTLIMFSFAPGGKRKKTILPPKDSFGHIQWIRSTYYYAIVDSTGAILKGTVISDMDHDKLREGGPVIRRHDVIEPPIETVNYDSYGNQMEDDKYRADGKLYNKITHEYYPNGDLKELKDSTSFRSEKIWKYTYKYNSLGEQLDSIEFYSNGSMMQGSSRRMCVYDSAGRVLEELSFNVDTITPNGLTLFRYNNKNQLVETDESKIENGNRNDLTPTEKNDFWYDSKGRIYDMAIYRYQIGLVKNTKITFDSAAETTDIYSYEANKVLAGSTKKRVFKATNTTQEDTYDADGVLIGYTISHDSANHVMDRGVFRITYHPYMGIDQKYHNKGPGDTVMIHHLINDRYFNPVVDDYFSTDGSVLSQKSYQYTYDSVGNWIEKIEFDKDNKPVKIIEREIIYFKD